MIPTHHSANSEIPKCLTPVKDELNPEAAKVEHDGAQNIQVRFASVAAAGTDLAKFQRATEPAAKFFIECFRTFNQLAFKHNPHRACLIGFYTTRRSSPWSRRVSWSTSPILAFAVSLNSLSISHSRRKGDREWGGIPSAHSYETDRFKAHRRYEARLFAPATLWRHGAEIRR